MRIQPTGGMERQGLEAGTRFPEPSLVSEPVRFRSARFASGLAPPLIDPMETPDHLHHCCGSMKMSPDQFNENVTSRVCSTLPGR